MNENAHELDELLSAYLDNELAADERARVEARLAADPAARELLHELQHVSQSVQSLPPATLPESFRDAVLRRAQSAAKATAPPSSPATQEERIHVSVGRTRRAWIWASLAVAAALLIMVTQREPQNDAGNGAIALHRTPPSLSVPSEAARSAGPAPVGEILDRAASESPPLVATAPTTRSDELASAGSAGRDLRTSAADSIAGAPAAAPASDLSDLSAASAPTAAVPLATSDQSTATIATDNSDELVIVHVLAKRKALETRAFDQLLVRNGVAVDPQLEAQAANARRVRALAETDRFTESEGMATEQPVEAVLVEAPETTIFQCMNELNRDLANYESVAVDESPAQPAPPVALNAKAKKLALDLGKFSRGIPPQQQRSYFYSDSSNASANNAEADKVQTESLGVASGGQYGAAVAEEYRNKEQPADSLNWNASNRGRAQRLANNQSPVAVAEEARNLGRQMKAENKTNLDNMQVLFVLAPADDSAAPTGESATPLSTEPAPAAPTASPAVENPPQ